MKASLVLFALAGLMSVGPAMADHTRMPYPQIQGCIGGNRCAPSLMIAAPAYVRMEMLEFYASSAVPNPWTRAYVNIFVDGYLVQSNVDVTAPGYRQVPLFGTQGQTVEIRPATYVETMIQSLNLEYEVFARPVPYPVPVPVPYPVPVPGHGGGWGGHPGGGWGGHPGGGWGGGGHNGGGHNGGGHNGGGHNGGGHNGGGHGGGGWGGGNPGGGHGGGGNPGGGHGGGNPGGGWGGGHGGGWGGGHGGGGNPGGGHGGGRH